MILPVRKTGKENRKTKLKCKKHIKHEKSSPAGMGEFPYAGPGLLLTAVLPLYILCVGYQDI